MKLRITLIALLIELLMVSCEKNDIPSDVISPNKMSNILKELHLAEAFVNSNYQYSDSSKFVYKKLEDSILLAYETKQSIFDSSMIYYQKNVKLLDEIYTRTVDSLSLKEGLAK